jgi:hypothetical protein
VPSEVKICIVHPLLQPLIGDWSKINSQFTISRIITNSPTHLHFYIVESQTPCPQMVEPVGTRFNHSLFQ